MKTVLLLGPFVLPILLGGTACGQRVENPHMIVRVKNPGDRAGYLGVSIQDMTRRLARAMDVKTDEGALVDEVIDESPAEGAGLKDEDIIIEMDGKKIADADDLRSSIRKATPGTKVSIVVMRKDEKKSFTATIDKAPHTNSYSYSYTPPVMPRMPRAPRAPRAPRDIHIFSSDANLGMSISSLNKQLGKYFDAPDGKGVLVQEVEEDSRAEKAGFLAGDVIVRIGKETIKNVQDVTDALDDFKKDEKAEVEILRKGAKKTLTFEVPDMDRPHRLHLGSGNNWLNEHEFDLNVDPPDFEWNEEGHGSFERELMELKQELLNIGREIQVNARKLQQELRAKINLVMS
jgi:membrane-associated protease RseP (regulator of RpoE activity)